ncbi:hypothetical protein [Neisseria sicca]|uniref:hypothetical protein n=1 Tax=Neisseria sicca TaxID=490 RepID=UPI00131BEB80|nr:hypothetical protein [Neisseria sicca]
MQEPLYSLSWQATIRTGKRCFTCSAFFYRDQQGEWGATPCLFGSVRVIFLNGYAAPFAFCQSWHG